MVGLSPLAVGEDGGDTPHSGDGQAVHDLMR